MVLFECYQGLRIQLGLKGSSVSNTVAEKAPLIPPSELFTFLGPRVLWATFGNSGFDQE